MKDAKGYRKEREALYQSAEVFMPYLSPPELASISQTSKSLHSLAKSITVRRSSDASRGFEKHPIPFINSLDNHPYSYFIYTPSSIPRLPLSSLVIPLIQPWGGLSEQIQNLTFSDSYSCLPKAFDGCSCSYAADCGCGKRRVEVKLKIVRVWRKGWGLHAGQAIRRGEFVCEYSVDEQWHTTVACIGELLTTAEARKRQQKYDELASCSQFSPALLVVREHLPSGKACLRINIDATRVGNVARFINHSCDGGNLLTVLVRNSGELLPRLCLFAARDIDEDEELSFSYGDERLSPKGLPCFCGSSCCFGTLPSEQT